MRKRSAPEIRRLIRAGNGTGQAGSPIPAGAHHLHHYLHLASWLGADPTPLAPTLFVPDSETARLLARWQLPLASERPLCALNGGAEYGPAKRWPAERFIAAAREIQVQAGCHWLILGGKGDLALASELAAGIAAGRPGEKAAVTNLAGNTSLRELCALLQACQVLLSNDTGPMHVAAALGTPVVAPFGSTSPELTGPGLPDSSQHRVLRAAAPCAPCFRRECPIDLRCLRGISEAEVVQAVLEVLRAGRTSPTRNLWNP
jgi:heptosyltransferase-2